MGVGGDVMKWMWRREVQEGRRGDGGGGRGCHGVEVERREVQEGRRGMRGDGGVGGGQDGDVMEWMWREGKYMGSTGGKMGEWRTEGCHGVEVERKEVHGKYRREDGECEGCGGGGEDVMEWKWREGKYRIGGKKGDGGVGCHGVDVERREEPGKYRGEDGGMGGGGGGGK